jgi:hypothetical protein
MISHHLAEASLYTKKVVSERVVGQAQYALNRGIVINRLFIVSYLVKQSSV